MDRIRCYERRDGGSIPSRGAKILARRKHMRPEPHRAVCQLRNSRVRAPRRGTNFNGVTSVVVCTAVCETVRQGSIPGFTPRMIISVVEYLRDMEKVASSNLASSTIYVNTLVKERL